MLTAAVASFLVVLRLTKVAERRRRGDEAGPVAPTRGGAAAEIRDLLRDGPVQGAAPSERGVGRTGPVD